MIEHRDYLGDGVYVGWDGTALILTTEDGLRATNTIVLEPEVIEALERYIQRLRDIASAQQAERSKRK